MSGLLAIRCARGAIAGGVQILRALAFDNQSANFTAGLVITGSGVLGTGTLTGTTIADGDTVTIGSITYTFQAVLVDEPYNVLVGASDSDSLDNLIAAINGDAGEGTLYGTGTVPHTLVSAAAGAGDTMVVTELEPNAATIATTATLTAGDWGAATLEGGIAASGATGTLVEQTDGGASGTLILRDVQGEFTDNERLLDSATGVALAAGTLSVPLLTPSDSLILQADAEDVGRSEAIDMLARLKDKLIEMPWHADNGLFALRVTRGGLDGSVERLGALGYDGQTVNFTVGHVITGGTSGATGRLVEQTDGGATGTLILADVQGIFENNDALTDEGTGNGDATGAQAIPVLTPSDQFILQVDGVDMSKAEALEALRQIELVVQSMDWPAAA